MSLTTLEIIDTIRMRDPQSLPMSVVWDVPVKKVMVRTAAEVGEVTKSLLRERIEVGVRIEFEIEQPTVVVP